MKHLVTVSKMFIQESLNKYYKYYVPCISFIFFLSMTFPPLTMQIAFGSNVSSESQSVFEENAVPPQGSVVTHIPMKNSILENRDNDTPLPLEYTENVSSPVITPTAECTYTLSPTSASYPSSGGTGSVSVKTKSNCTWTATSNVTWISITSGSRGTGKGTIRYTVSPNIGSARTGTITIAGNTFTVSQSGITCSYSISPSSNSFNASGGTGSVTVSTQSVCPWTATSNASWITITSGASGTGNGTVKYSVSINSGPARSGTINIASNTFTVSQDTACTYSISHISISYPAAGGSGSVSVTTQSTCPWTAVSNASWITITSGTSGTGNGTVSYSVSANSTISSRTSTMTIAGKTFTVNQSGITCSYSISPTSNSFTASGGTGTVTVSSQSGCPWTATSNASWITITSGTGGTGNGTVNYSVSANSATSSRSGTMSIAGKTFTISQDAGYVLAVCSYFINPISAVYSSNGGTGSVSVTTQSTCSWTAASNAPWVTITSGASGTGNGTVEYSVAGNASEEDRTGTMTIAGVIFSLLQEGNPTVIDLVYFTVYASDQKVILEWVTASEINNAGFNLYRAQAESEEYVQINDSLIPAEGSSTEGASYQFFDDGVKNWTTYNYVLENIDIYGTSTLTGPVSVTPQRMPSAE